MESHFILMDAAHIKRIVQRMAIQVLEQIDDGEIPILIGLNERGKAMAIQLKEAIEKEGEAEIEFYSFSVSDAANATLPDCNDRFVLLIDDVIFSGKTMFKALSLITQRFEVARIMVATLVDRGHRRYPILSNFKGMYAPTKLKEHVEVLVKHGALDQVILFKN
ncbi:MAG: phosphoribosyltransferase family protein [Bacteroidota bacterium]